MKTDPFTIQTIPTVLYGEPCEKVYLFIHGQGGNKEEAAAFANVAVPAGYQVLAIDLPEHGERKDMPGAFNPWTVLPELELVSAYLKERWSSISVRANSIGAYFSMLAFADERLEKALFVSPIVDLEKLIHDMMQWAGVSEDVLHEKLEIATNFGQTLSWRYLCWVREHPLAAWSVPTFVLYPGHDAMTSRVTITNFVNLHKAASLCVYEPGEHWFHTEDQLKALYDWEQIHI